MRRFEELDSLRGLAALSVLAKHYLGIFIIFNTLDKSNFLLVNLLKFSPLIIIIAGNEAVITFFILSGFVLSLPYYKGSNSSYSTFVIRRICRIYLPYLVAISLYIIFKLLVHRTECDDLSHAFNSQYIAPHFMSLDLIINHLLLIGAYNGRLINNVIWSLIEEMRISIIFPFLMYLLLRYRAKNIMKVGFILSYLGYVFASELKYPIIDLSRIILNYLATFQWIILFIIGALIAKYRVTIAEKYNSLSKLSKFFLLISAVIIYTHFKWLYSNNSILNLQITQDWLTAIGASLFIIISISSTRISKILVNKIILFFGKISYSLYLYHMLSLFLFVYLLQGKISVIYILLISFITTIVLSYLSYKFIEIPCIRFGKYLTDLITRKGIYLKRFNLLEQIKKVV